VGCKEARAGEDRVAGRDQCPGPPRVDRVVPELGAKQLRLNGARDVVTSYAEPGEDGLQVVADPAVSGIAGQCRRGDIEGVQAELPDRRVTMCNSFSSTASAWPWT
jgi:hypothetical protein